MSKQSVADMADTALDYAWLVSLAVLGLALVATVAFIIGALFHVVGGFVLAGVAVWAVIHWFRKTF